MRPHRLSIANTCWRLQARAGQNLRAAWYLQQSNFKVTNYGLYLYPGAPAPQSAGAAPFAAMVFDLVKMALYPFSQPVAPILTITNMNVSQPLIRNIALKIRNKYPQGLFVRNHQDIVLRLAF